MNSIAFLREIYTTLNNEKKEQLTQIVDELNFLRDENGKLKVQANIETLPEAPTSATAKVVSPKTQMEWLVTVRGYATNEMVKSLIANIQQVENDLAQAGFISFDAYVDQRRAERQSGNNNQQSNLGQNEQSTQQRQEQFEAEELVATVDKGRTYWKIKGGKFRRFGVIIWPEVLQSAGFSNELDPMQVYNLNGWIATVVFKDDGKVNKVIKLEQQ